MRPNSPGLLWFVQLDGFARAWRELDLEDDDLRALEVEIMAEPALAPVIAATGGVRKLRFAPASWRKGTSGAVRVYYAYFAMYGLVLLIFAHRKNVAETITQSQKQAMKRTLSEIETYLRRRWKGNRP